VVVLAPRNFVKQSQADFHYVKGQDKIRCSTLNGGMSNLKLCVWDKGIGAIWEDYSTPLSAKEIAAAIVQRMVTFVEQD